MLKSKSLGLVYVLVLLIVGSGMVSLKGTNNTAWAEDEQKIIQDKIKTLRAAAEKFADAYKRRDFNMMYQFIVPKYRQRVPLWEYKDFVDYPGVTDGYIEVEVPDVSVLPKGGYKYGKVMMKIVMVETERNKTTGEIRKIEDEKWVFQDWVELKGKWYRIEKLDSN